MQDDAAGNDDDSNLPAKKDVQDESKASSLQDDTGGNDDDSNLPAKKDDKEEGGTPPIYDLQSEKKGKKGG